MKGWRAKNSSGDEAAGAELSDHRSQSPPVQDDDELGLEDEDDEEIAVVGLSKGAESPRKWPAEPRAHRFEPPLSHPPSWAAPAATVRSGLRVGEAAELEVEEEVLGKLEGAWGERKSMRQKATAQLS